jgi:hypothetical protein
VKSFKRFDLNLNLKGCFEKSLKKKKKENNLLRLPFGPVVQQPANLFPRGSPRPPSPFLFFLSR